MHQTSYSSTKREEPEPSYKGLIPIMNAVADFGRAHPPPPPPSIFDVGVAKDAGTGPIM